VTWPAEEDRAYAAEVGRRLRGWRLMRRLTQQQVADRAGVDRVVVLAAERGAVAVEVTRLRRLAWAVGAPLPDLVDEDRVLPRAAGSQLRPAPRRR
jgi:transcriptional regulator with XRE-family HTH domain